MCAKPIKDDTKTKVGTTGHSWDGIEELNTPLPRWWLWTFYLTILFAIGYTIAYPAWPLISGATPGVLGASTRADVAAEHFQHTEDSTAQVASERDLEFAIGEHETAELQALDAALARLDGGRYGLCTDCGVAIPKARLDAAPEAPRCLACQTQAEHTPPAGKNAA